MPQPALHIFLARRALEECGSLVPFRVDASRVEAHFLHGALAPDMGFFPGCETLLSRMVHTDGNGRMARALLARAQTDAELAFAWGWLTHVLADAAIHPIVNAAASVLVRSEGANGSRAQRLQAHARIEVGLDAGFPGVASVRCVRLDHVFDSLSIAFLARTLHEVYDVQFGNRRLLAFHRRVTHCFNAYLRLTDLIRAELGLAAPTSALRLGHLRRLSIGFIPRDSAVIGFLRPALPSSALIDAVAKKAESVHRSFSRHLVEGMTWLDDYDLDSGRIRPPALSGGRTAHPARPHGPVRGLPSAMQGATS